MRYPDWRVRLHHYLEEATMKGPVEEVNCAAFAAGAVEAMTGENPLGELAGKSPDELFEWVMENGYGSAEDAIAARIPPIENRKLAMVGDIAVLRGNAVALGVVIGPYIKVFTPEGTVGVVPLSLAKTVFRP